MIWRQSATIDGHATSIGPVNFQARGVLIVNRSSVDAFALDDAGNRYDCPAHVATTWPLAIPSSRMTVQTVVPASATDTGSLIVTITDETTILSTAQLSTINLSGQTLINGITGRLGLGVVPQIQAGSGMSGVVRNGVGDFTVSYTKPFAAAPIVVATSLVESTFVTLDQAQTTQQRFLVDDKTGARVDGVTIYFIAIATQ